MGRLTKFFSETTLNELVGTSRAGVPKNHFAPTMSLRQVPAARSAPRFSANSAHSAPSLSYSSLTSPPAEVGLVLHFGKKAFASFSKIGSSYKPALPVVAVAMPF